MPGKSLKYHKADGEWKVEIMNILSDFKKAFTIDEIKNHSIILTNISTQKMGQLLKGLVDMGLVQKEKNIKNNKMTYFLT